MNGYPIELDLHDRRAVVVGGGSVALRRARALVEAGARVTVIAPRVADELTELPVTVLRRDYQDGDLSDAWLVHAATNDAQVNERVAAAAEHARIWCIRADDGPASAARMPAVTRHGDITVAVTAGGDPGRSRRLRSAIGQALSDGSLPQRHHRRPGATTGTARGLAMGGVALVGGGPGDPELITVRGRRLLAEADVVVADRLGPSGLLAELDPDVEIIHAGKSPGAHHLTQDQINALIVDRALAGSRVVRLKGGDPFVFGRGGEEALACTRAGLPVQVVPGVTSAIGVPAYAGIPVTHRGIAQDFTVVSGHLDPSRPGATVDWEALAGGLGTLVLLMAVTHLDTIAAELIKRGRDAATPVAVIRDGTTPRQQVLVSRLDQVAAEAARHGIRPPAVVVIGEVVRLSEHLSPTVQVPLAEHGAPASAGLPEDPGTAAAAVPPEHPGTAAALPPEQLRASAETPLLEHLGAA
jgi:uroporphyrin-III C-methyltransferase/precorrin-2 dehydrogenase/sirohydrochlorin ferrochelatase